MGKKGFGKFGKGSAILTSAVVLGSSLGAGSTSAAPIHENSDVKSFFNNCTRPFMSQNEIFKDIYDNEKNEDLNNNGFSLFNKDNQDMVNKGIIDINKVDEDEPVESYDNFSLFGDDRDNDDYNDFSLLHDDEYGDSNKVEENKKKDENVNAFNGFSFSSNNDSFSIFNNNNDEIEENKKKDKNVVDINAIDEDEDINAYKGFNFFNNDDNEVEENKKKDKNVVNINEIDEDENISADNGSNFSQYYDINEI